MHPMSKSFVTVRRKYSTEQIMVTVQCPPIEGVKGGMKGVTRGRRPHVPVHNCTVDELKSFRCLQVLRFHGHSLVKESNAMISFSS